MTTTFKKAGDRIKKSAFVLPVFFVFLLLWLMSIGFAIEDYSTSFWGYELLPTQVGYWWTAYLIAALPSVGQIAAGYIAIALGWNDDNDRKYTLISLVIWLSLFAIDATTDMFFRMNVIDPTWTVAMIAVFQTVGIFTIGSELAFVVGFGMTFQLLPDAIAELFGFFTKLKIVWNDRFQTKPVVQPLPPQNQQQQGKKNRPPQNVPHNQNQRRNN